MAAGSGSGGNHSPRHLVDNQQSRSSMRPVSWNQVVRGESEHVVAAPSSPLKTATVAAVASEAGFDSISPTCSSPLPVTDDSGSAAVESLDGNAVQKPVWNRRSNGLSTETEPVMGWNASWPALSESTKSSTKSSSCTDLLYKGLADGSSVSEADSQGIGSIPFLPQRHAGNNASTDDVGTTRNKLSKHNAFSNDFHQQQLVPLVHVPTTSSCNSSPKEHSQRSGQLPNFNDHPQYQGNSPRNRNGGPHQRGGGSHHHSFGGRRDQDRGNQERNNNRSFNGRDNHMHPRVGPKFVRPIPPPNSGLFVPPPVRAFGGPISFPELALPVVYSAAPPLDPLSGVPFVAPIPHHLMFVHSQDPLFLGKIVNQIDYYFSNDNLIKDIFLRRNMDDQGWISADLIARFNKVVQLTDNIPNVPLILEAMRTSSVVEVQGDKIRRRNDWNRWIIPPNVEFPKADGPQTNVNSDQEDLSTQVGRIELERRNSRNVAENQVDGQDETFVTQTTFGVQNSQLQLSGEEAAGKIGDEAASDQTS